MTIKRITDMSEVLKLVPIEVKLRAKEKSEIRTKDLLEFVQKMITNPHFYVIAIYDDAEDKVIGYMVMLAVTANIMNMKCIEIYRVWYDHTYRKSGVRELGWDAVKMIAEAYKIHKVRFTTRKHVKAFEKAWGFEPIATVMERRI